MGDFRGAEQGKTDDSTGTGRPRNVLKWVDHLGTALEVKGKSGSEAVLDDRKGRW